VLPGLRGSQDYLWCRLPLLDDGDTSGNGNATTRDGISVHLHAPASCRGWFNAVRDASHHDLLNCCFIALEMPAYEKRVL